MLRVASALLLTILGPAFAPAHAAPVDPHDPDTRRSLASPLRHVRGIGPAMNRAIAEGLRRSPTFADLVAQLDRSDVIVYAEPSRDLPLNVSARMLLLPALQPRYRYVRVQLRADMSMKDAVMLLGHELRHALELADAPDVRDEAALISLYRRIGDSYPGGHRYDTAAARETGRRVRSELVGS
jgi:hypothetical protein